MLGAVIGDIVGSQFEWTPIKSKKFELLTDKCCITDDNIMTFAVAQAIMDADMDAAKLYDAAVHNMQKLRRSYPWTGYNGMLRDWIYSDNPRPYMSFGNGAASRISPCAFAASSLEEALMLSQVVTSTTHNHSSSYKAASAVATSIFMARKGAHKEDIEKELVQKYYGSRLEKPLDSIRRCYHFDVTCEGSVPQAIRCFLEADSYEDAVRNAVSLGGNANVQAAIAGAIAGAYYGISDRIICRGMLYLDPVMKDIVHQFYQKYT